MKNIFIALVCFFTFVSADYTDTFNTNTTPQYTIENTWTASGVGSFTYDSSGERAQLLTGDNVALRFSHALNASVEGSFSVDFLPVVKYPGGGVFELKLIQDANTYYVIKNTDGYGAVEVGKYINGVKVDSQNFLQEYTQNVNYTLSINFSPTSTTIEAFGETLVLNSNSDTITVNAFSIEIVQQDAYFDNIVYSTAQIRTLQITTPQPKHIQTSTTLLVKTSVSNIENNWGVQCILDENTINERSIIDSTVPFNITFPTVSLGEHIIDCYIIDEHNNIQTGNYDHVSVPNVGVGEIFIAIGESITSGYGDDISYDDISLDGRNTGGGYTTILSDYLSAHYDYPYRIINEGLGGERTQEGLSRLSNILTTYPDASTVLVLYGTNDTATWVTLESGKGLNIGDVGYIGTYKDYMQQMINLINASGKKAVIGKVPIILGFSSNTGTYNLPLSDKYRNIKAIDFNIVVDELVWNPLNSIVVVPSDFYNYFLYNYLNEYFDNLHPNGIGYQSMAGLWRDTLIE